MKLVKKLRHMVAKPAPSREYRFVAQGFDRAFYLEQNPDVRADGMDPVLHYVLHGQFEGRDPTPTFSTAGYLARNPDVAQSGINAFYHYMEFGRYENRDARPLSVAPVHEPVDWKSESEVAETDEADIAGRPVLADVFTALQNLSDTSGTNLDPAKIPLRAVSPRMTGIVDLLGKVAIDRPDQSDDAEAMVAALVMKAKGKAISFDVFGTLLRPRIAMECIALRNARACWLTAGQTNSALAALHPIDLLNLRAVVEAAISDEAGQYRIEDLAARLGQLLGLSPDNIDAFAEREAAITANALRPDPLMSQILSRHAGRHIGIARSPLPAAAIRNILQSLSVGQIAALQASHSQFPLHNKDALLDLAIANEHLEHGKSVHLSTDYAGGVEAARLRGLDAIHLYREADFAAEMRAKDAFARHRRGDSSALLLRLLEQVEPTAEGPLPIAAQAVPVVGFVLHILEQAVLRNLDKIFFVTREGLFFKRIYDLLVEADVFDLGAYPKAIVLETSRKASFAASLAGFDRDALMRLWSQYSDQSIAVLCQTINLSPDALADAAKQARVDLHAPRNAPWNDAELLDFLSRDDVQAIVLPHLKAERDGLLAYLKKIGFEPGADTDRLLVDIGWRGTIQDNLVHVVKGRIHGCYYGLEGFLNAQPDNVSKDGYIKDVPAGLGLKLADVAALEFLFNTPGGSVRGYRGGVPVREVLDGEEAIATGPVAGFQDQIADFARDLADTIRQQGLVSADLRAVSRELVASYFANPPAEVACAYLTLEHNESFGVSGVTTMGFCRERLSQLRDLTGPALHAAVLESADMVRWTAARPHIGSLLRQSLALDQARQLSLPVLPGAMAIPARLGKEIAILAPSAKLEDEATALSINLAKAMQDEGYRVHLLVDELHAKSSRSFSAAVTSLGSGCILHSTWPTAISPAAAICFNANGARFVRDHWPASTALVAVAFPGDASAGSFVDAPEISGAHLVCISPGAALEIGGKSGVSAALGGTGLDPVFFQPRSSVTNNRHIILHANGRAGVASLRQAVMALDLVKTRYPDVSVTVLGNPGRISIGFAHDRLALPKSAAERHALYQSASIAVFDNAEGPTRDTLEAMASGCIPVDVYRRATIMEYPAGTAVLALPKPHSLALAICNLLESKPATLAKRAGQCSASLKGCTQGWQIDLVKNALMWAINAIPFDHTGPLGPRYSAAPVVDPADDNDINRAYIARQKTVS